MLTDNEDIQNYMLMFSFAVLHIGLTSGC